MSFTQPVPTRKAATTKGDPIPLFEQEDWDMLQRVKRELAGYTVTSGANFTVMAAKVGETANSLGAMMRSDFTNLLSRTQLWAAIFDLRVDFVLRSEEESPPSEEMQLMKQLAAPVTHHKWQRMLLNERLIDVRTNLGLSDADFGSRMGVGAEAARAMENKHDWLVPHLFRRVRALGGVLEFRLVP